MVGGRWDTFVALFDGSIWFAGIDSVEDDIDLI